MPSRVTSTVSPGVTATNVLGAPLIDHIPGTERDPRRDVDDAFRDGRGEVEATGPRRHLSVDADGRGHVLRVVELGLDPGAQWRVAVSALALKNLLVDGVAVDVGHVVDHRVAEHVVEGGVQGQPFGVAADDDG